MTNDPAFQAKLNVLSQIVVNDIDRLFEALGVSVSLSGNKYVGACPIHGGDNESALNVYYDGYNVPGFWRCRTKHCELTFGKNIIGFSRGVLSRERLDYSFDERPKAIFGFMPTVHYLCDFVGTTFDRIKFDHKKADRQMFVAETLKGLKTYVSQDVGIPRDKVRNSLQLPAEYYLNRGYSGGVLDAFDVGTPKRSKPENKDRVIVPIYNEKELMIGYCARSIHERCGKCKLFHGKEGCPKESYGRSLCSKWRNVDFESSLHLYNYYKAKPHIINSNTAILVEGPGDVLRLEEAGIHNALAMFGTGLSEQQQSLLAKTQTMSIILMLDADKAGQAASEQIKRAYGRLYRMYFPKLKAEDVGDMQTDEITRELVPILKKLEAYAK